MNQLLQKNIKRYCLIAIKKFLKANQINDEKVDARQKEIVNKIKNQKTLGLEFIEKVETLENEYHDLELKKSVIDFDTLKKKVITDFKNHYEENLVIEEEEIQTETEETLEGITIDIAEEVIE